MFATIRVLAGTTLASIAANQAATVYREFVDGARKLGLRAWAQDYEGLRLALIFDMISHYERISYVPEKVAYMFTVFAATGRRFYSVWATSVSRAEVDAYRKALDTLARDLGTTSTILARYMGLLVRAVLRLLARRQQVQHSLHELWVSLRSLAYATLTGGRHAVLDQVYRLLRLVVDPQTGLGRQLTSTAAGLVEELGISLDQLEVQGLDELRIRLNDTLRRLALAVA